MGLEITSGSLNDLEDINEINKVVLGRIITDKNISEKTSDSFNKEIFITLAKIDGKLVGYGLGYFVGEGVYYFGMLGALENFRRKGIGRRILDEQISFAKGNGAKKFTLKTYNQWKGMLRLTIKMGFEIIDLKFDEKRKENAIYLKLEL